MKFLDATHEPVRRWAYGTALAVLAGAVVFGLLTGEQSAAIGAIVGAALLVPGAEVARSKVSSPATVDAIRADAEPVGDSDRELAE